MSNKYNFEQKRSLKSKDFWGIWIIIFILFAAGFALKAEAASPSHSGVYNPYNEPVDHFDPGFDFDNCGSCDDYYDNNNNDEPDATTRSASSVGDTNATLNAHIDGNGSSTRAWFEYGRDRDLDDETSEKSVGSNTTNLGIRISGLRSDTLYYYRVVARNSEGTDAGSIMSFRTDEDDDSNDDDEENDTGIPSTRTDAATFVTANSANLNSFVRDSGSNRTNVWFEWGANGVLGNTTQKVLVDASPSFTHRTTIVGLTPGVTYYFRAVAENDEWRNNGSVLSFTTPGSLPPKPPVVNPPHTPPVSTGGSISETPPSTTEEIPKEEVEGVGSGLAANVLGFGFFPSTLLGWLAFIVLILTLYILGRKYLYPPAHTEMVVVKTHDHHH